MSLWVNQIPIHLNTFSKTWISLKKWISLMVYSVLYYLDKILEHEGWCYLLIRYAYISSNSIKNYIKNIKVMVSLWWGRERPKFLDKYMEGICQRVTTMKACVVSTEYAQEGGRHGESMGRHLGFPRYTRLWEKNDYLSWMDRVSDWLTGLCWCSPHSIGFTNFMGHFSVLLRLCTWEINPSPGSILLQAL